MATCNCRTILTTDVAVTGDNLVLTIPEGTYVNCENYVIRVAQDIPSTATNLMPVVIQIGTAATQYPVLRKCGHHLYANQIRTRRNYILKVAADTSSFVLICGYICAYNCGAVASLPVPVTTTAAVAESKKAVSKDA